MQHRYSPRITITLRPQLLASVKRYEQAYHWKRSAIIQSALEQWLAKQQPLEDAPQPKLSKVAYDPQKLATSYFKSGMSGEEILDTLLEYEAATELRPHG